MLGATGLTINVAALLVALPTELVATHSYSVPLLAIVVAGVVYEALVAPEIDENEPAPGASCFH